MGGGSKTSLLATHYATVKWRLRQHRQPLPFGGGEHPLSRWMQTAQQGNRRTSAAAMRRGRRSSGTAGRSICRRRGYDGVGMYANVAVSFQWRVGSATPPVDLGDGGWSSFNQATRTDVVGGGNANQAANWYSTVGGGYNNGANNQYATVGGGGGNQATRIWFICRRRLQQRSQQPVRHGGRRFEQYCQRLILDSARRIELRRQWQQAVLWQERPGQR